MRVRCAANLVAVPPTPPQAEVILGIGKNKRQQEFLGDSYALAKKGLLSDINFLNKLLHFSEFEKDMMNDETIELLSPYMDIEEFLPAVARNASKAAEGLCTWVRAMVQYHHASKVVKPKLEALNLAEERLQAAELELQKATDKLNKCKAVLDKLQAEFEAQMADKTRIEENAARTRNKMQQATALIGGLAGERKRWTNDSNEFADRKRRLPGDCALACAFVRYVWRWWWWSLWVVVGCCGLSIMGCVVWLLVGCCWVLWAVHGMCGMSGVCVCVCVCWTWGYVVWGVWVCRSSWCCELPLLWLG